MITAEQVQRFAHIFKGYDKAHGRFKVTRLNEDRSKREGNARTVHEPISYSVWEEHLTGSSGTGLGVVMLLADDTCLFGAIDIDNPNIDHTALSNAVEAHKLPLVVCRSKSGGAHCYVFLKDPVPAATLRDRLDEWKSTLGFSKKTETFPKQISRVTPEETGNWINLPYFNAERTDRYAVQGPRALTLDEFGDLVDEKRISADELTKFRVAVKQESETDPFYEGPPCLITIFGRQGFEEGTRNNGMFNVGVYLKRRYPDDWQGRMDKYNKMMANLPSSEIVTISKSLSKAKEYNYRCSESPIADFCDRRKCLRRKHGVSDNSMVSAQYEISNICRLDYQAPDPPMWTFEVNGRRVMVENDQLYSVDAMNRACMSQANCVPLNINMLQWRKILNTLIQSAEAVTMPTDASPTGQLWERILGFAMDGAPARIREEVWAGQVLRENNIAYFRSQDLFQYLKQRGVRFSSESYVWQVIKSHGGYTKFWNLKRFAGNVWCLPIVMDKFDEEEPEQQEIEPTENF